MFYSINSFFSLSLWKFGLFPLTAEDFQLFWKNHFTNFALFLNSIKNFLRFIWKTLLFHNFNIITLNVIKYIQMQQEWHSLFDVVVVIFTLDVSCKRCQNLFSKIGHLLQFFMSRSFYSLFCHFSRAIFRCILNTFNILFLVTFTSNFNDF